jgi:predicted phage-related endonuclease
MRIHNLIQGSPEWIAYRASHFNASDAPAMMGVSPYKTRAELLRELHTGVAADIDPATSKRFANGHRVEALARPLAEEMVGAELYPVTGSAKVDGVDRELSASFDGLTMDESTGFEHKALNAELRAAFADMQTIAPEHRERAACRSLPLMHRVQMEQQLLVSGAERILFIASEWDAEGGLVEELDCWYYPEPKLRADIVAGWAQFERDLAAYVLPDAPDPAPVGKAPDTLPALRIEVTGQVTASNLAEFKATALEAIRSVNRELTTDQHFADAEKAVKWCAEVEDRLKAAKEHALSQTASIDALFKTIDDISAEARRVRLDLDKLVTRRKTEVKEEAVDHARKALDMHIAVIHAEIAPMRLPAVVVDFAGAIKGKKSLASMQDALDTVLAAAKIAADAAARAIRVNIATFKDKAAGFEFLFADLGQIVHKAPDDFALQVQARIDAHKVAEAERARKAAEAEAERKRQAEAAEAARLAAAALQAASAPAAAPAPAPVAVPVAAPAPVAAPRADEPATLRLGTICDRLGFTMTSAFVADTLGIKPAKVEGASKLYRDSDFGRICTALQKHIACVREAVAA